MTMPGMSCDDNDDEEEEHSLKNLSYYLLNFFYLKNEKNCGRSCDKVCHISNDTSSNEGTWEKGVCEAGK